jgi:hypothetical protein
MRLAPDPAYLYALVNQNLTWRDALSELVDNSFDAGATRVEVIFEGKTLRVRDDGEGVEDIGRMLTLGHHTRGARTRLGRYGVGLKDAAIWLAPSLDIHTIRGLAGTVSQCVVNWDQLAKSLDWNLEDPQIG